MQVKEPSQPTRIEPRWPVVLTVLVLLMVLTSLQSRIRLLPSWSPYAIGIMLVLPMIGVRLSGGHSGWVTNVIVFSSTTCSFPSRLRRRLALPTSCR
jgi:hypothetical protein